jgi:aspartyl-tRNA(Asn)/glutamyl-tRNA(Gln) amidotransferase subunit A
MTLFDQSISQLHQQLLDNRLTIEDLVHESHKRAQALQPTLNAFTYLRSKEELISEAKLLQKKLDKNCSSLYGIPYVLKDSYSTKGISTSAGSNVLQHYLSPYNATVYKKLKDAGAILIGKTNMDAWGHGATTENTDFGPAKNPYDQTRSAGGSTGGTAIAIATRMVPFGIGEDTGGSIRNPASHCNITGLKVTYGRVSRYGCIAYASSFDTVGPMAKNAADCAAVLQVIAGKDQADATSSPQPVPNYQAELKKDSGSLSIGVPEECLTSAVDSQVSQMVKKAMEDFTQLGHSVTTFSMPELLYGLPVYYLIAPSETSSNLGRYDGVRFGQDRSQFTKETMRRILTGTYALSAGYYDQYYRQAQKVRTLLIAAYQQAFSQFDIILMPVSPTPPPLLGDTIIDPVTNMLSDIFTITHNIVGIPSLSLPGGFTQSGLPMGFQLGAPMFQESKLLSLGQQYQHHHKWFERAPETI